MGKWTRLLTYQVVTNSWNFNGDFKISYTFFVSSFDEFFYF
jgi:hypothetical protein